MLVTTAFPPLSVLTVLKAASLPPKPKQAPAGRFIHSGACRRGKGAAATHPHKVVPAHERLPSHHSVGIAQTRPAIFIHNKLLRLLEKSEMYCTAGTTQEA